MVSLHYSRNGGISTMCGLLGRDERGHTVNSWTNARMMTDCPDCIKAAEQSVQPTNDGLIHADSESTPAVISG